jgi:hypothetical protein
VRELWTCPSRGKRYVNKNNWHSCRVVPLDSLFAGKGSAHELFDAYLGRAREIGPVDVDISQTGLAFMTRVRFAGAKVRRNRLRVGFWLRRRVESPRIVRTEFIPPDNWIHELDVTDVAQLDDELQGWLREAYVIGAQQHPTQQRYRTGDA